MLWPALYSRGRYATAHGVRAQLALCAAACFAAFDDLLTVTVQTADCNEGHGPLLALGRYQAEAQCDSNLSPSPLLEHYPSLVCPAWRTASYQLSVVRPVT
jgi:hypothetical protein